MDSERRSAKFVGKLMAVKISVILDECELVSAMWRPRNLLGLRTLFMLCVWKSHRTNSMGSAQAEIREMLLTIGAARPGLRLKLADRRS